MVCKGWSDEHPLPENYTMYIGKMLLNNSKLYFEM